MQKCDRCGKGVLVGMNVSHAHNRTKKRSYPNLHKLRMKKSGRSLVMNLCTKCLRIVKAQMLQRLQKSPVPKEKEVIEIPLV